MKTLADALGLTEPADFSKESAQSPIFEALSGKEFCDAVTNSREFRIYILDGITSGTLPPAILCRVIDHAWGKPPERVEHTGPNGNPIVTEVRRVIVRAAARDRDDDDVNPTAEKSTIH